MSEFNEPSASKNHFPDEYDGSRGYGSSGDRDPLPDENLKELRDRFPNPFSNDGTFPKQYEMPGQSTLEVPCSDHPDAPHGFDRNGSHNNDRYTCECEGWEEMMIDDIIGELQHLISENAGYYDDSDWKKQISFLRGLK